MILANILGVILTPALYRMVQGLAESLGGKSKPAVQDDGRPAASTPSG